MKTTALIIDDELRSRRVLKRMLSQYCEDIYILGETDNIDHGLELIKSTSPDILFLDIQLKNETGFELLGQIPNITFQTIFVTAYDSYAIKAIKWSAQDYILKPVDPDELKAAVNKAISKTNTHKKTEEKKAVSTEANIGLPTMDGLKFVPINTIMRCEAKGTYTHFFFDKNESILVSKSLQVYENLLKEHGFFRIHKSHLVNLKYIKEYIKGRGGHIVMKDNTTIGVALRKKEDFLKRILH
ncbi:MAG: LytTR family DNA-binding domain-containing protein [Flavipsychrobacter sp.]